MMKRLRWFFFSSLCHRPTRLTSYDVSFFLFTKISLVQAKNHFSFLFSHLMLFVCAMFLLFFFLRCVGWQLKILSLKACQGRSFWRTFSQETHTKTMKIRFCHTVPDFTPAARKREKVCDVKVKLSHHIPLNLTAEVFLCCCCAFLYAWKAYDCKISRDVIKSKNLYFSDHFLFRLMIL